MPMPADIASLLALDPRIRDSGRLHQPAAYVSVVSTASTVLLTAPTGATLYLICLIVTSRVAGSIYLTVGTGTTTFVQVLPRMGPFMLNLTDEHWIPPTHFAATITVQASASGAAPADIHIMPIAIAVG
mgnify:CR=1 FL=1